MFSGFAGKYLCSNNLATVNIDDHIEVKMLASDPGRQIADVPPPDLIRRNGPEYIRAFILTFTGAFIQLVG
ncbi:hypothetical protein PU67_16370 [Escherichia coli]|nr:hypothetical protein PU67_16370 [Escherichia coli]